MVPIDLYGAGYRVHLLICCRNNADYAILNKWMLDLNGASVNRAVHSF